MRIGKSMINIFGGTLNLFLPTLFPSYTEKAKKLKNNFSSLQLKFWMEEKMTHSKLRTLLWALESINVAEAIFQLLWLFCVGK